MRAVKQSATSSLMVNVSEADADENLEQPVHASTANVNKISQPVIGSGLD